jgi:hypothetical protein
MCNDCAGCRINLQHGATVWAGYFKRSLFLGRHIQDEIVGHQWQLMPVTGLDIERLMTRTLLRGIFHQHIDKTIAVPRQKERRAHCALL